MREISEMELRAVGGADGKDVAQLVGGVAGTWLSGGNAYAGAVGVYVGGEIYSGIQNGYTTAPGVTQGVGSYNPNYNPNLMVGGGFGGGGGYSGGATSAASAGA